MAIHTDCFGSSGIDWTEPDNWSIRAKSVVEAENERILQIMQDQANIKRIDVTDPELDRLLTWYNKEARPAGFRLGQAAAEDLGRNDPCFCKSGKKYKHCCLNKEL